LKYLLSILIAIVLGQLEDVFVIYELLKLTPLGFAEILLVAFFI